jgi:orotate phosphoribosyltransferase
MEIIPTPEEVIEILRKTGALREGHFELPTGRHANRYLQMPLAMRHFDDAKMLSVALSRLLRSDVEISKHLPRVSIVCPATGGLPVAYGVGEALRAQQIYWAERQSDGAMQFRQFIEVHKAEKIILVDDILRSGKMLRGMLQLFEECGAQVLGLGVIVKQPNTELIDFSPLPIYYLCEVHVEYYADANSCALCRQNVPIIKVWPNA